MSPALAIESTTVQAHILHYAQEIVWTYMPRDEAKRRRGVPPHPNPLPASGARECAERARKASLFFGDLIDWLMTAQIRLHELDLSFLTEEAGAT